MISVENIQYVEWALIIGFVLGIVTIVVGYMDMKKKSKNLMEGFSGSAHFPEAHDSLLLDSIYNRRIPETISYDEQSKKVPKSHVQSYKQYTNNGQSKSPCGGNDFKPNMCPYAMEKSPVKKPEMCIPAIQEGRIGWFIAKTQMDN
jgi:hypothetical protein